MATIRHYTDRDIPKTGSKASGADRVAVYNELPSWREGRLYNTAIEFVVNIIPAGGFWYRIISPAPFIIHKVIFDADNGMTQARLWQDVTLVNVAGAPVAGMYPPATTAMNGCPVGVYRLQSAAPPVQFSSGLTPTQTWGATGTGTTWAVNTTPFGLRCAKRVRGSTSAQCSIVMEGPFGFSPGVHGLQLLPTTSGSAGTAMSINFIWEDLDA